MIVRYIIPYKSWLLFQRPKIIKDHFKLDIDQEVDKETNTNQKILQEIESKVFLNKDIKKINILNQKIIINHINDACL